MNDLSFPRPRQSDAGERMRMESREFLNDRRDDRRGQSAPTAFGGYDPEVSEALGARGWIGMGFPKSYGGGGYDLLDRYVVLEELLGARAPITAHSVADRQSGFLLLRYGCERHREEMLPRIAAGKCYFCIGMSEPDSGSDLASVRTRATKVDGGWLVNGAKIWTTNAHRSHYMILLCRTSPNDRSRHAGLSRFLVDMKSPGITCRPITNIAGEHDFNEVHFEDVLLADDALIGREGDGWNQVTSELAFERAGPERFLLHLGLLEELADVMKQNQTVEGTRALGRLVAHLTTLRRMSRSVATLLADKQNPALHAALVKDLGTCFEQDIPEVLRLMLHAEPDPDSSIAYSSVLARVILDAPSCTIRGGTKEMLRGIMAKALDLR